MYSVLYREGPLSEASCTVKYLSKTLLLSLTFQHCCTNQSFICESSKVVNIHLSIFNGLVL